jgi:transposase
MIDYKSKLIGIKLIQVNESYTSKYSALDLEKIGKHDIYIGKRLRRGLFISKNNIKINADLNSSINILRNVTSNKELEIIQTLRSRGQVLWPMKINLHKETFVNY